MGGQGTDSAGNRPNGSVAPRGLTRLEWWVHAVAAAGILIQFATGFVAKWILGGLAGWALFAHMIGAPLVIIGLTGTALIWADRCRFGSESNRGGFSFGQKLMFWIAVLLGFAVVLSMLAAMLPVFGYAGQHVLKTIHETGALLLVIAMVAHTFVSLAARGRRGKTG